MKVLFLGRRYFLGELRGGNVHPNAVCASGAAAGSWRSDAGAQEGSLWSAGREGMEDVNTHDTGSLDVFVYSAAPVIRPTRRRSPKC